MSETHVLESEILKWKDRALKLESGFKVMVYQIQEMQSILSDTEDLRSLLERKIHENQILQNENQKLRERMNQSEGSYTDDKSRDPILLELSNAAVKQKREYEALKLKKKEEELHRQYQMQLEELEIQLKNERSDWSAERKQFSRKIEELEEQINFKNEESALLLNELSLNNEQLQELQNHGKLQLELRVKEFKDNSLLQQQASQLKIKTLEEQNYQLQRSKDNHLQEIDTLLQQKNTVNMRNADLQTINQHLALENEGLKQTLLQCQKQRDQDEFLHEDIKKKDTLNIKRYYETILEQVERENRSLRSLLDAKSKEIEELFSKRF